MATNPRARVFNFGGLAVAFFLATTANLSAFYFTGGPVADAEANTTRDELSTATSALQKIMEAEKSVADELKTEEEKKMMESFGKEVQLDLNAPLDIDAVKARTQLDQDIKDAIASRNGNSDLAAIVKTQVEQQRRLTLFHAQLEAIKDSGKQPLNFSQQLELWNQLKTLHSEMVIAQLAEMQQSNALKTELIMRRTKLMQHKSEMDRLNQLYGNK